MKDLLTEIAIFVGMGAGLVLFISLICLAIASPAILIIYLIVNSL